MYERDKERYEKEMLKYAEGRSSSEMLHDSSRSLHEEANQRPSPSKAEDQIERIPSDEDNLNI